MARLGNRIAHGIQLGALTGGTLGLVVGLLRARRRATVAPAPEPVEP